MIKAKVTVFDDETGQVFEKDRVIEPYKEESTMHSDIDYVIDDIEFRFEVHKIRGRHNCLNCKHFSMNKPTPYADNCIYEHCTLHIGGEKRTFCDDYEADL